MFSSKEMPSASSLFTTYASMTASAMLVRTMVNDLVPNPVRVYAFSAFRHFFKSRTADLTLIIEENNNTISRNQIYDAAEVYLSTKVSPNTARLRICKNPKEKNITIRLEKDEKIVDCFQGVQLKWRFIHSEAEKNHPHDMYPSRTEKRSFELSFPKNHKDLVFDAYVPFILEKAKAIKDVQRVLRMFTLNTSQSYGGGGIRWDSINLEHPSTFETLAMEPDLKNTVMDDLDRFVRRKDFYKKVGRAWKRGYLLYGPPGTGKSSLVAAMANYLKFDIYDLQLANIMRDSDLRRLLLSTGNRSILVIEDIDCSVDLPDRRSGDDLQRLDLQSKACGSRNKDKAESTGAKEQFSVTLSGLLNFIDGLWSSCGDERIIIFTTNHKERLDPALLRPGRMDMHIHMSYCTPHGFKLLASNYLGISGEHSLYAEIESLMETAEVTPAQVAGELMKNEDADVALGELVNLLKRKKLEGDGVVDETGTTTEVGTRKLAKRQKAENTKPRMSKGRRRTTRRKL